MNVADIKKFNLWWNEHGWHSSDIYSCEDEVYNLCYAACEHMAPRPTPADVERLKSRITELEDALRWFCGRVEKGEVISKRTYALFKALLDRKEGSNERINNEVFRS